MPDSQASRTSPSLLEQLRGDVPDQVAWAELTRQGNPTRLKSGLSGPARARESCPNTAGTLREF